MASTRTPHRVNRRAVALAVGAAVALAVLGVAGTAQASSNPLLVVTARPPVHIALSPDGSKLYVTEGDSSGTQLDAYNVPAPSQPYNSVLTFFAGDVAVSKDGSEVYYTEATKYRVASLDHSFNKTYATAGVYPRAIAVGDAITGAWVANDTDNSVGQYSLSPAAQLVHTVLLPNNSRPWAVAVSTSRGLAVVAENGLASMAVINTAQHQLVGNVTVGTSPCDVALSSDGNFAYVVNFGSNNLTVVDISTPSSPGASHAIQGLNAPQAIAIGKFDGRWAYVGQSTGIAVIDLQQDVVVGVVPTNNRVLDLAVAPDGSHVYAAEGAAIVDVTVPQARVTTDLSPTVAAGATVSIKADVEGPVNSLRWQVSSDDGQGWNDIDPTAAQSIFTFKAKAADNGKWFRLHLGDTPFGDRYGDIVQLTVTGKDPASSGSGGGVSGAVTGTSAPSASPTALATPDSTSTPGAAVAAGAAGPLDLRWVLVAGLGALLIALLVVLSVVLIRRRPAVPLVAPAAPQTPAPESIPTAAASASPTAETVIASVEPPTAPTVQLPQADGAAPTVAFAQPAAAAPPSPPRRPMGAVIALATVGALLVIALVVVVTLVLVGRV